MAPRTADMTVEDPVGRWGSSPVEEVKLIAEPGLDEELHSSSQEVMCYHGDTPTAECASITDSEEQFCRICHEGRASGELLSPCECSGSLASVHRSCLEQWLTASDSGHCELCHHQFVLEHVPKPLTEWWCSPAMQQQRRTLCSDAACFLFITPLASLSGWLCVQGAMELYYTNGTEALGLLVLTLALIIIYVFWTVVSVRYHVHLFKTWKKTDQRVRLWVPVSAQTPPNQQVAPIHFLSKAINKETMV
ncbi:E3 ubiquitin-protein ligase MARCH3 [Pundamilia nyererei]|uniref:E3 ubiquitin-protein ligase MARCH3-like n=1 Tax=Pundamilia nyererei TaxID=303518 RepID=A0A9Y3R1D2_9CICH|nr:PREDICTED: E3 ubiquitin-protein ligase MARCH3-like [Pundamilia nyererei]XP_005726440.1 PREDICTED: E3 ubiquitin-protein ligase MARCH3-like [Pundamilia nyererei]